MVKAKKNKMIKLIYLNKSQRGITLIALVVTIALILIISSATVYTSLDRFQLNNFRKMANDIELLTEEVSNLNIITHPTIYNIDYTQKSDVINQKTEKVY